MPWKKGNKLKLVSENQAQGRTREIYDEIKLALGLPHVNAVFQAFAAYPTFLDLQWRALQPVVQTQEFFSIAERLRADVYTRMHNYFEIPDLWARISNLQFSSGVKDEIASVVDLFHYNNPLQLVMVAALFRAFETRVGQPDLVSHPCQHPVYADRPVLIEEEFASTAVKQIYEDMKRTLGLPFVNTDYRAFARWPEFLSAYWISLKNVIQSPVYEGCQHGVRETTWSLLAELPGSLELDVSQLGDAGMSDADIASVVRITELLQRLLSGLVLNVALAKIGLEGGNRQALPATHPVQAADKPQAA